MAMKTDRITPVLLTACLLAACGGDPKESPLYRQLAEDHERATAELARRDSALNEFLGALNRISENLRTIRSKQGELVAPPGGTESPATTEERIMGDLERIDALLAENKALLAKMRKQAKADAGAMAELQRTVEELERSLEEKDAEIAGLKEQLASTNSSLATLIEMYRDKSQLAEMQRNELNTAWYAVGTAKELRENGVLTKEGGVAGIGGVNKLNTAALPANYFTRIDISRTTEVPVLGKKAKLATAHPEGSYRLENGAQKLVITDADRFWSISKYLVVVVD
jgi:hypothetical protein